MGENPPVAGSVPARCAYCRAALEAGYYFCLACGTPYRDVEAVLPATLVPPPSEIERVRRMAPAATRLFWTYFALVLGMSLISQTLITRADQAPVAMVIETAVLFVTTAVFAARYWRSLAVQFKRAGLTEWPGVLAVAAVGPLLMLNYGYHSFIQSVASVKDGIGHAATQEPLFGPAATVLLFCLLPAVTEEIAFRGLLQHWLQVALKPYRAVVVASALFAVMHFTIVSAPYLFLVGLLLGWAKWRTGSLYPSMLIHFLHNLAVVEFIRI